MMIDSPGSPLLVALDGSSPADPPLDAAAAIGRRADGEVHVLHVSDEPLSEDAVAKRLGIDQARRPHVRLHSATGDVAPAVCRVAREIGAGEILLLSHGATADLRLPAGHVTLGVLECTPSPVYVLRSALNSRAGSRRLQRLRRILVPLDGSAEASRSVEHASLLAARDRARLLLLHVLGGETHERPSAVLAYADQSHHAAEAWEEEFVRSSFAVTPLPPAVNARVALRQGDPAEEIVRFAREEDCDLVVAAWGGRMTPGRARVVRKLLEEATCPLLFLLAG